jgi:hypothetical protein
VATKTYDFVGVTSPSATHVGFHNNNADLPPATGNLVTDAEFNDGEYLGLATDDGIHTDHFTSSNHELFQFDWLLDEDRATVTRIDATVDAQGSADSANGWNLYIRNNTTPAWELLATKGDYGWETLTGAITANLLDYITAEGRVYVLAEQIGVLVEEGVSLLEVDFAELDITYTPPPPPSTFVQAQCNG